MQKADDLKIQAMTLEPLLTSNEPSELNALFRTLDEKKLAYLRLIVQTQQEARQAVYEANYYRFNLRFAATGLFIFGLVFYGLGTVLFFKFPSAVRALNSSYVTFSTLVVGFGMGLFNAFDCVKLFFLDKWYFGKENGKD